MLVVNQYYVFSKEMYVIILKNYIKMEKIELFKFYSKYNINLVIFNKFIKVLKFYIYVY